MKRFEYRLAKVNDLAVNTEEDPKNGRQNVTTVTLQDEPLAPSERFWTSLYARYGFSGSFFRYFSHAEVFGRISSRESDSLRVCIERDPETGEGRLLAVSSPGCERRLKSAARGGRKVQRWGWVWNLLRQVICSKDRSVRPSVPLVVAVSGHL